MKNQRRKQRSAGRPSQDQKAAAPKGNVREALALLATRLERIEKAFDTNTEVFSDGIKMLEVQQSVSFRILQDVFNGQVRVKGTSSNEDGVLRAEVDVHAYIREHLEELTKLEEAPKEEKAGPGPILASANDEQPITFGGDFAP